MNLEEQWKAESGQGDQILQELIRKGNMHQLRSHNPMHKIRKNLKWNIGFAAAIAIGYLFVFWYFPYWPVFLCIGIIFLFTVWGVFSGFSLFKQISRHQPSAPILETLEYQHSLISKWIRHQEKAALLVYPFAGAGGYMVGGMVGSGKSIELFMSKPVVVWALIITLIIIVPLSYWLARWMNRKAFGTYLDQLRHSITALQNESSEN